MAAEDARIAVVGAGPAGLICASLLAGRGLPVRLFEKSRGTGGRVATRQGDGFQFDHGAQFIWDAAGDPFLASASGAGAVRPWGQAASDAGLVPHVGVPRMKDFLRALSDPLDISFSVEISDISRVRGGWELTAENHAERFDIVVLAIPAPQILGILDRSEDTFRDALSPVAFRPCYALLLKSSARSDGPDLLLSPNDVFDLVLRDSSKPGRPDGAECWVAHASDAWSREHLELDKSEAAGVLLSEFRKLFGPVPEPLYLAAHRWRFSQASQFLGSDFISTSDGSLYAGGDWALGPGIEDALRSGRAMADAITRDMGV